MTFVETNSRIDQERRAKFCGTASVSVRALCFTAPEWSTQTVTYRRTVEPYKRKFREERGSRTDEHQHHVKAVINAETLAVSLQEANITVQQLREQKEPYVQLELPPGTQLQCLQRYEKVLAATEASGGAKDRWTVDLYLDDLSAELRRLFLEEHDYQEAPTDGEFYRKIREYQGVHGQKNPYFERLWLGQLSALSKNRRSLFDQLCRNNAYLQAFDSLLTVPALFSGFRLTVIHQMISMRCEEPAISYLKCMLDMWMKICGSDEYRMREIDPDTVRALQGMAPGACRSDHAYLWEKLKGGQILGNFTEQARAEMWSQICSVSQHTSILSLHTFFEDLKFLKGAADSLKRLLRLDYRDTIKGHLESIYRDESSGEQNCVLQLSDCDYKLLQGPSAARFELAYRQLWLAAFRVYQDLP
ncbi:uncharacterized protein B0I36DRAFT_228315, partial [Microdochium trichocladiopsis]